VVFVNTLKTA